MIFLETIEEKETHGRLQKKLTFGIALSLLLFFITSLQHQHLPDISDIDQALFQSPIQEESTRKDFSFSHKNQEYLVSPLADYELWGLVVSHNDIHSFFDSYHNNESVDMKDICVVWGENISNGVYQEMKIENTSWTCWFEAETQELYQQFQPNQLSNNHLLTNTKEIRKALTNLHKGDQVHLTGSLVDYTQKKTGYQRRTSLSREDTNQSSRSGGACEVFFVDSFEILQKGNAVWHLLSFFFGWNAALLFLGKITLFFQKTQKEKRALAERRRS